MAYRGDLEMSLLGLTVEALDFFPFLKDDLANKVNTSSGVFCVVCKTARRMLSLFLSRISLSAPDETSVGVSIVMPVLA